MRGVPVWLAWPPGLLDAGTKNRSRAEIHEEVDSLGAALTIAEARETVSLDVHFLAKDFPRMVEILSDILASPTFPRGGTFEATAGARYVDSHRCSRHGSGL